MRVLGVTTADRLHLTLETFFSCVFGSRLLRLLDIKTYIKPFISKHIKTT